MSELLEKDVFKKIIKLSYRNFRKKEAQGLTKSQTINNIQYEIEGVIKDATRKHNS